MAKSNAENPQRIRIALGVISADLLIKVLRLVRKIRITGIKVIDSTGVAEDGTNFVRIQVKRGSVLLAEHSTETANEGALAAGVWSADFPEVVASPAKGIEADRGDDLDVNIDVEGSGALTARSAIEITYYHV